MTPDQKLQADCYLYMRMAGFKYERRRLWTIWAAKHRKCPKCEAEPWTPCLNGNEIRKGNKVACRMPHAERIDWERFLLGLKKRGIARLG